VTTPRPVRALVGTQLEAQTPVIGALHPVAGQDAVQAGVGGLGRLGEGLRRKQGGYLQFGGEPGQIGAGGGVSNGLCTEAPPELKEYM
jgi:hypothetical protein